MAIKLNGKKVSGKADVTKAKGLRQPASNPLQERWDKLRENRQPSPAEQIRNNVLKRWEEQRTQRAYDRITAEAAKRLPNDLNLYKYNYAPPDLQVSGNFAGNITNVYQPSSGKMYSAAQDALRAQWKRNHPEPVNPYREEQEQMKTEDPEAYRKYQQQVARYNEYLAQQRLNKGFRERAEEAQKGIEDLDARFDFIPEEQRATGIRGITSRYSTDPEYRELMDERLYDAILGTGAYQEKKASFAKEKDADKQAEALREQITQAWNAYDDGDMGKAFEILSGKDEYAAYRNRLKAAEYGAKVTGEKLDEYKDVEEAPYIQQGMTEEQYLRELQQGLDEGVFDPETAKEVQAYIFYHNAPDITNSRQYSRYMAGGIEQGLFDDLGEITMTSSDALKAKNAEWMRKIRTAQAHRRNADEINAELYDVKGQGDLYDSLQLHGLYDPETGMNIHKKPTYEEVKDKLISEYWRNPENRSDNAAEQLNDWYDSLIYDTVHGEGSYADVLWNGTDEEYEAMIAEIDDLWARMENGTISELGKDPEREAREAELADMSRYGNDAMIANWQRQIDTNNAELERREKIGQYSQAAGGYAAYNPELVDPDLELEYAANMELRGGNTLPGHDRANFMYWMLNRYIPGMEREYGDSLTADIRELTQAEKTYRKYSFMTDEMLGEYNKLYESGMTAAAEEYLKALDPYLTSMASSRAQEIRYEKAKGPYGGWYGAATVIKQPWAGLKGTIGSMAALMGDKNAADVNSFWYTEQKQNNTVRGARAEAWGDFFAEKFGEQYRDAGKWWNGVMYSTADNLMAMLLTKGAGSVMNFDMASKTAMRMIQTIMSSSAASSTMVEKLEQGMQPAEAALYALGNGYIEAITEKYSIEALFSKNIKELLGHPKDLIKFVLKQAIPEGTEEGASNILGTVFDELMSSVFGHESEMQAEYNALVNKGVSKEDASRQVWGNWKDQLISEMKAGAMSGLMLGTNVVAQNQIESSLVGKKINSNTNLTGNIESGYMTGAQQLAQAAEGMAEGTESRKAAEDMNRKFKDGRKPSNREVGNLARMIVAESSEEMGNVAEGVLQRGIEEELTEKGMEPATVGQVAAIIAKAVIKEDQGVLTKEEMETVAQNKRSVDVMRSYLTDEGKMLTRKVKQIAAPEAAKAQNAVRELVAGKGIISTMANAGRISELAKYAPIATDQDIQDTNKGRFQNNGLDAVWNNQRVQIIGRQGDNYILMTEDGRADAKKGDVKAVGEALGVLMEYAERNRNTVNDSLFDALLSGMQGNRKMNSSEYISAAMAAYIQHRTGAEVKNSALTESTLKMLQENARKANEQAKKDRIATGQMEVTPGKGTAEFNGAQYGTKEWNRQLNEAGMTKRQKNEAGAVAEYARRLGLHVNFVNDPELEAEYGWEDRATGKITINLAGKNADYTIGGQKYTGGNHHLLVTAAHEFTHWLEQNSPEMYEELRQYVFSRLRKQGVDIGNLVMKKIDMYRMAVKQELDIEGAMAEIVANACDQVLGSEKVAAEIEKENQKLYEKVKQYVKNLVARIRQAAAGMENSMSYESRKLKDWADALEQIWLKTLKEAQANAKAGPAEAKEEGTEGVQRSWREDELYENWANENEHLNDARSAGSLAAAAGARSPAHTSKTTDRSSTSAKESIPLNEGYVKRALSEETQKLNDEYMKAVKSGNMEKARQMVWDKITKSKGIYPFIVAHEKYEGQVKQLAKLIKGNENQKPSMNAIHTVAVEMAKKVMGDAVLVPMPGRHGIVNEGSDTMLLAKEISRITGMPVINALQGEERESRHEAKKASYRHEKSVKMPMAKDMGFRQVAEIPEGKIPYIIDNVVSVGETAKAAIDAIPGSLVLAYAKGAAENVTWGLKSADVTTDNGEIVPLNKRIDIKDHNWRHSIRETETYTRLEQENDEARETERELRERYRGLTSSEEYTSLQERFHQAEDRETRKAAIKEIREWEENNHISELKDQMYNAAQKVRETQKAIDDYYNQMAEAEEREIIEKSGLSEAEWRRKEAVKQFGYTTNFKEAGYLLPNGKMLNFSGEKGMHTGHRGEDHRSIGFVYATKQGTDAMNAFMADGNIRIMAETPGIDIISTVEPTEEQYAMIRKMAEQFARGEYFNVDFSDERGYNVDSIEYDGRVNGTKIVNDIKSFYKTGEAPQQSLASQFHYSIRDDSDMEINRWMQGLTESSLQTAQERVMLQQWKEANGNMNMARHALAEQRQKLQKLEALPNPSAYDKSEIIKTRNRMEIWQNKVNRYEKQLLKATGEKGFANMMYRQSRIMNDLVNGRTEDEVHATVDAINASLESMKNEMAARSERLKELAKKEAVIRIRQQLNSAGLKRIAAKLKTDMNSELSNTEIENRLALMALKMKEGRVDEEDVTELADMLIGKMRKTYDSYILDMLRGTTITLSASQLKELKAKNSSLREIRQELAGTGIRIDTKGGNTLDKNWAELCKMIPALNEDAADKDMLDDLLRVIAAEKEASRQQYAQNMDMQVAGMVIDAASELVPEIVTDKKSMQLIRETLNYIAEMSREAEESAKALEELNSLMNRLQEKGKTAKTTLNRLEGNIRDAIEYNNALAEQSEAATWKGERHKLIMQLNDEHTKEMLRQQAEFRQKLEKDKTARKLQADNMALRRRINTNISRLRKLLIHETTKDNVPEYLKGLTRTVLAEIVNNDMTGRKITGMSPEDLAETARVLAAMEAQDGAYSPDELRNMDEAVQDVLFNALEDIRAGIDFYNASTKGNDIQVNLQAFKNALTRISDGVSAIASIVNAERSIALGDRRVATQDQAYKVQESAGDRKFRERTGKAGMAVNALHRAVISGNLTPEYFFKMLKNAGLNDMWEEYHRAENRNGLELAKAKARLAEIADKYGYADWDMNQRVTVPLESGDVKMTIGQLMALQATWKREHTLGPAMSNHLGQGGFYVEEVDPREGIYGRQAVDRKAHRVTESDMQKVQGLLTQEQLDFVDAVVSYMSNEMSELGNEASMKAYGIRMYKEAYYYPFKMWDGVKSRASNDSGNAAKQDRAFHPSFSKTRLHGANNALILGDFMQTATDHIVGMINYATMGLANENLQKVLNQQVPEGDRLDRMTKRNIRTVIEEAYGREAMRYLAKLQEQLNGGAVQVEKSLGDRAISLFRKNAVAGSLSVAAQQPLSYIRAAMMLNPKYLSEALVKGYWKDSYKQRLEHSGVSVIKDMGRFDMGFGQSAREFLTPDGKQKTAAKVWDTITDVATKLPELMDRWTWNRLWVAVKAEQHDLHPGMDVNSDEFLYICSERFNDIVRKTQVYDSVLTKSQNMRSQNYFTKSITSFMAEPTLTLNVLADALQNVKEKGGKAKLAKAGATFILSAVAQAAVKALMSSGRSPDDKKTWKENFLYRLYANMIQEGDPMNLVPGYNDLVSLLKNGELEDDALGMFGKIYSAWDKSKALFTDGFSYRTVEDSIAQLAQLFTNLPAKNLMRDARAMYNFFTQEPYAKRETSNAVLKLQAEANLMNADNLVSVLLSKLNEAGFKTTNTAYYGRMFDAMQTGDKQGAEEIKEYLQLVKGVKDETIDSGLRKQAKEKLETAEADAWMIKNDLMDGTSTITMQYKEGKLTEAEAKKLYKAADPKLTDDDIWWKIDRINYQKETKAEDSVSGYYYRLTDAVNGNRAAEIQKAVKDLLAHGITKDKIKNKLSDWKKAYLEADSAGKVKIRDAMQKAYKAAGYTSADADKTIEGWKKDAQKNK